MTNEEALETLLDNAENGFVDIEEVKLVFAELQSNSDEDHISRKAVLDMAEDMTDQFGVKHRVVTEGMIRLLSPVNPQESKAGHWCDYCPNCGVKMSEIPASSEGSDKNDND